jgi:anti-anti-sigma regulatory factor
MALEEAIVGLRDINDTVILAGMRPRVADTLRKTGVLQLLAPSQIADTRLQALEAAEAYIAGNGAPPPS